MTTAAPVRSESDYAGALKAPDRFYIDGEWVRPISGERRSLVSPGSGRPFLSVAMAGAEDIDRAVAAARRAFDQGPWPRLTPCERAAYVSALGHEIVARADLLAGLQTAEMGAVHAGMLQFVPRIAGMFAGQAKIAETFPFVEPHDSALGGQGYLVHEPVGVVGAIVPWNGPLLMAGLKLAPLLVAGCTVVLKASPEAPASLLALAEAIEAVGLPAGVFNLVTADREASETLVRHPGVDKISFTGSTVAGRRIGAICADRVARCSLELGGKSPAILLDDFDVDLFADKMAAGAVVMSGQVCASLTRLIVPRAKHDQVVDAIASRFAAVAVGDPFDAANGMGPLASDRQCTRVRGFIEAGKADGTRIASGGDTPKGLDPAFYLAPTLFADVDNQSTIAREEIFGPVLSVIAADSEAQATAIANDTNYGLNAAVFTNDADRAFRVARQIRSGTVGHNGMKIDFSIAFGGFKQSGIGREGGVAGLRGFLEPKTVLLEQRVDTAG